MKLLIDLPVEGERCGACPLADGVCVCPLFDEVIYEPKWGYKARRCPACLAAEAEYKNRDPHAAGEDRAASLWEMDRLPRNWSALRRSDAEGPIWPIAQIEARTREQLMQRMLAEARFQMGLLGTMISWAENQEWARRKGK